MNVFDSLGAAKATGIALLIWTIGLFMAGGAALEARVKADDRTKINLISGAQPAKLVVKEEEVTRVEYEKVTRVVSKVHPEVNIALNTARGRGQSGGGITVRVDDVADYYTFIIVMYDILTSLPEARWSLEQMCAGEECSTNRRGDVYTATLKAHKKKSSLVSGG